MPRNASLFLTVTLALVWAVHIVCAANMALAADKPATAVVNEASFDCHIPDLKLPPTFKVYAASAHDPGPPLPLKLNETENEARLVEVQLNSPDEPVALMLGTYQPTIWHFNWTAGTKVVAVVVSGYDASFIMGLPDNVPVLDTGKLSGKTCQKALSVSSDEELAKANDFARHLFQKDIDQAITIQDGRVLLGQPLSDKSELLTEEEFSLGKFTNPAKPLTYKVALEEAERKGLIRKAVKEDVHGYLKALAQGAGLPAHLIDEGRRLNTYEIYRSHSGGKLYDSYVVLSDKFQFPVNLYPLRGVVRYILPEGISRPDVRPEKSEIFSLAEAKSPNTVREEARWVCGKSDLQLPSNVKIYAGSGFLSSPVEILSSDKYDRAELVPVVVNSPNEPVALILKNRTFRSNIWHFSWTEGTQIAAVVADGRTIGLPSDTPVLDINDCQKIKNERILSLRQALSPDLQFPSSINSIESVAKLADINELSRQLFKKDIAQLYFAESCSSVIGEPLKEKMKLLTAEELKAEDFINPDAPWGGSMTQDILGGKIRKATIADMWSRAAEAARELGLPEHILNQITLYNRTRVGSHGHAYQEANPIPNAYMVLSPEFSIPAKLYQAEFQPIRSFHGNVDSASASFFYPDGSCIICSYRPKESQHGEEGAHQAETAQVEAKPCGNLDDQLPAGLKLVYKSGPGDDAPESLCPSKITRSERSASKLYVDFKLPDGSGTTSCSYDSRDGIVSMRGSKPISEDCGLPGFIPPANLKVYAVGAGSSAGSHLNIPLYNKDRMDVGLIRLTINSPREPVALMLEGSNPTIWHLNWTTGTKIAAVVFSSGFYSQRISGLPEGVPVLHIGGACPGFSTSQRVGRRPGGDIGSVTELNALANHLFQADVEGLYEISEGRAFIGQAPLVEMRLETAKEFNEEDFISPDFVPAGLSAITYAVSKGLIRRADEADYRQWLSKYYINIRNVPEDKVEEAMRDNDKPGVPPQFQNAYVILSDDFIVPPLLPKSYKRPDMDVMNFLVSDDVSLAPEHYQKDYIFYMLKDGSCQGKKARTNCEGILAR